MRASRLAALCLFALQWATVLSDFMDYEDLMNGKFSKDSKARRETSADSSVSSLSSNAFLEEVPPGISEKISPGSDANSLSSIGGSEGTDVSVFDEKAFRSVHGMDGSGGLKQTEEAFSKIEDNGQISKGTFEGRLTEVNEGRLPLSSGHTEDLSTDRIGTEERLISSSSEGTTGSLGEGTMPGKVDSNGKLIVETGEDVQGRHSGEAKKAGPIEVVRPAEQLEPRSGTAVPESGSQLRQVVLPPGNNFRIPTYDVGDAPAAAPRARGLYNIPKGWNLDKAIDPTFYPGGHAPSSRSRVPSYRVLSNAVMGYSSGVHRPIRYRTYLSNPSTLTTSYGGPSSTYGSGYPYSSSSSAAEGNYHPLANGGYFYIYPQYASLFRGRVPELDFHYAPQ